jgi:hypothetical protein
MANPALSQVNRTTRRIVALGALTTTIALVVAAVVPSTVAFAAVVLGLVLTVGGLARLTETYAIVDRVIHHHTWIRSVAIDANRIVAVERPDAESSVRELLVVDDQGRSISVPLSRLHDRDEFAIELEALLASDSVWVPALVESPMLPASHRTPVAA